MELNELNELIDVLNDTGIIYEVTGYDYYGGYYRNDNHNAIITWLDRYEILDELKSKLMELGFEVTYNKEYDDYGISLVNLDLIDDDDPYGLNENSKYYKAYNEAENFLKAYNIIDKASCIVDSKYEYTIY